MVSQCNDFKIYLQNFTNEKGMAKAVLYYRKRMA